MVEFAALVHATPSPALAVDNRCRVVSANDAVARVVGIGLHDIVGQRCAEVLARLSNDGTFICAAERCVISGMCDWPVAADSNAATTGGVLPPCLPVPATVLSMRLSDDPTQQQTLIIFQIFQRQTQGRALHSMEMRLLGPTELILDGTRVRSPQRRRAIELLALLMLAGTGGIHRDRLLDALWPDVDMGLAGQRFRVVLHAVRRVLRCAALDVALHRHGDIYVLDTSRGSTLDAAEFERETCAFLAASFDAVPLADIEQTLARYRGDFAEGESFGAWADPYRARLRRLYYSLLASAARQQARCGAFERSAAYCERALRSDPLQERFQIALIACYGRLGRQADALRQYEEYRRTLAAEMGARPTQALHAVLLHALSGEAVSEADFFSFDEAFGYWNQSAPPHVKRRRDR